MSMFLVFGVLIIGTYCEDGVVRITR